MNTPTGIVEANTLIFLINVSMLNVEVTPAISDLRQDVKIVGSGVRAKSLPILKTSHRRSPCALGQRCGTGMEVSSTLAATQGKPMRSSAL